MKIRFSISAYLFYLLLSVSALSLASGTIYRLYRLDAAGLALSWLLSLAIISIIALFRRKINKNDREQRFAEYIDDKPSARPSRQLLFWPSLYALAWLLAIYWLWQSRMDLAIVSPWQAVDPWFWPVFIILNIFLWIGIWRQAPMRPALIMHYLLVFSLAGLVYRLGLGFDAFVHQATMEVILEKGLVDPKPFYYLGQYGLLVSLASLSLPLSILHTWLVPVLAALTLPMNLCLSFRENFADRSLNKILAVLALAVPFSIFVLSTPQNFAWLLLANIIIMSLRPLKDHDLALIGLLALTALITQPVAGIPAVLFSLLLFSQSRDLPFRRSLQRLIYVLGASALPLAFLLLNRLNGLAVNWSGLGADLGISDFFTIRFPGQESPLLNILYFYGANLRVFLLILAAAGLILAVKHRRHCRNFLRSALMGASLFISYLITRQLEFDFLIEYERGDYSKRVLITALLFCLPLIWLALRKFLDLLGTKDIFAKTAWAAFFCLALASSLYFSYPRLDQYHNSRGYSVSAADLEAVAWIDQDAGGRDYAVLANQQVSAAALRRFGFKKYYQPKVEAIFYYPIPTSGPLYQIYLDMVYEQADKATALQAADLTGAETVYFVLNKYWWAAPKIMGQAVLQADRAHSLNQGEVTIYRYDK